MKVSASQPTPSLRRGGRIVMPAGAYPIAIYSFLLLGDALNGLRRDQEALRPERWRENSTDDVTSFGDPRRFFRTNPHIHAVKLRWTDQRLIAAESIERHPAGCVGMV